MGSHKANLVSSRRCGGGRGGSSVFLSVHRLARATEHGNLLAADSTQPVAADRHGHWQIVATMRQRGVEVQLGHGLLPILWQVRSMQVSCSVVDEQWQQLIVVLVVALDPLLFLPFASLGLFLVTLFLVASGLVPPAFVEVRDVGFRALACRGSPQPGIAVVGKEHLDEAVAIKVGEEICGIRRVSETTNRKRT